MNYNICIVQPQGYIHSAAFAELAELIAYGLQDLGHVVAINLNRTFHDARNIIIGCHLLDPVHIERIPATSIIINTEQIADDSTEWNENIFKWISRFETWDYSDRNLPKLKQMGARSPKTLKIGFHGKLIRIPKPAQQDIDILFYGSIGDRRQKIIDGLRKTGRNVQAVFGVYGQQRDQLISRAKVILNMHHYNSQIFEVVRVFYLMSNSKAVVSEVGERTAIDSCYLGGIRAAQYENLIESCLELVANDTARIELERNALSIIKTLPQHELMRPLVG